MYTYGDVKSLTIDCEVVSSDECKVVGLALAFFSSLPPMSDNYQAAIDFAWGMHQPLGDQYLMEVSLGEIHNIVKAMQSTSTPSLDCVTIIVLKRKMLIILP